MKLKLLIAAAALLAAQTASAETKDGLHVGDPNTWAAMCAQWLDAVGAGRTEEAARNLGYVQETLQMVHKHYGPVARQEFLGVCQAVADNPNGYWAQQGRLAHKMYNERLAAKR